jgi:aryl-alcohol dehydrogenase-like predicted oxidoreductase
VRFQINLLRRKIETNGVLQTARELGIPLIAYVPLRSGLLTGKFHADRTLLAGLPRGSPHDDRSDEQNLDRTAPLIDGLREIAATHQTTVGQVALA